MTKPIICSLIFLVASMNVGGSFASEKQTTDGRFNSRCLPWPSNETQELCEVSFYRLLATPETYDKRNVLVTGFLVKEFNHVVLYPTEDRYKAGIDLEAIELSGDYKLNESLSKKVDAGVFPVTVMGTFDARYIGPDVLRLGRFYDIRRVILDVKIPEK